MGFSQKNLSENFDWKTETFYLPSHAPESQYQS